MRGRRRRRRLRRRWRRHDHATVDLDHARGRAACGAPVHHIGVFVKVHAPDGLGAVEPNVRDVTEALAIDTVASAVARLVATVRVLLVAQPLDVELGTRDRASGVVAVSIVACIVVCVARQWAGRRVDRHENDEGVRVLHGTFFGHVLPRVVGHLDRDHRRLRLLVRVRSKRVDRLINDGDLHRDRPSRQARSRE